MAKLPQLQKFEVVAGIHHQNGQIYQTGEVVGSPHDLRGVFREKFRKVDDNTPISTGRAHLGQEPGEVVKTPQPKMPPAAKNAARQDLDPMEGLDDAPKARKTTDSAKETASSPPEGKDVSERFEKALEQDYKVFKQGGKHYVYDADDLSKPLNPSGSKAEEVDGVIDAVLRGKK